MIEEQKNKKVTCSGFRTHDPTTRSCSLSHRLRQETWNYREVTFSLKPVLTTHTCNTLFSSRCSLMAHSKFWNFSDICRPNRLKFIFRKLLIYIYMCAKFGWNRRIFFFGLKNIERLTPYDFFRNFWVKKFCMNIATLISYTIQSVFKNSYPFWIYMNFSSSENKFDRRTKK